MNSFSDTRNNIALFHKPIKMAGGYEWSHVDTLKFIDLYYNSEFSDGKTGKNGYRNFFFNVVKPPCDIATKFIDLDTKDIILTSETYGDEHRLWLMQRDLRCWLKENRFGQLLNEIAMRYPKYGSVVVKRTKQGEWKPVNIQNLRLDPSTNSLEESMFVYEIQLMSVRDIRKMKWNKQEIDKLVKSSPNTKQFTVYECYDYQAEGKKWARSFKADFCKAKDKNGTIEIPESQLDQQYEYLPAITLFEDEMDELPYRELHWERVPGRWLGLGFVEYLIDNQIRANEMANQKAQGMRFSSLHLFETQDETIGRNVLDLDNGQIIQGSGLTPIALEERNFAAFGQEEERWAQNTERKTFSFDIARGGNLPSQTPLGVAELSAGMVSSYFEMKKENFGLFIKDIMLFDVIPAFKKDKSKEHILKFMASDKEVEKLRKTLTNSMMRKAYWDYAIRTGTVPSKLAWELEKVKLEGAMQKRKDLAFEIPDAFYDGLECSLDVQVTGEQMDVGARMQTYQNALQLIVTNPAILQDPSARALFTKMLELAGVSIVDIEAMENEASDQQQATQQQTQQEQQGVQQQVAKPLPQKV